VLEKSRRDVDCDLAEDKRLVRGRRGVETIESLSNWAAKLVILRGFMVAGD